LSRSDNIQQQDSNTLTIARLTFSRYLCGLRNISDCAGFLIALLAVWTDAAASGKGLRNGIDIIF
jgi:hypothetical protein